MGRKPTISRDRLLDLAEEIVCSGGGSALTIGALAQAAGISKGGVQYSFATKDDLVRAVIDRWTSQFDAMLGTTLPRTRSRSSDATSRRPELHSKQ